MARLCLRSALGLVAAAALVTESSASVGARPPRHGPPALAVGDAKTLSRIELRGARPLSSRREGEVLVLAFAQRAVPDVSRLRDDPPRFLKSAELRPAGARTELRLTPAPGAQVRTGVDDGVAWIDFGPAPAAADEVRPAPAAERRSEDSPAPLSGVVKLEPQLVDGELALRFAWRAPVAAAVFRRGAAVWLVFDAAARLDLSAAPHRLPQARRFEGVQGADFSAVRIDAPAGVQVRAEPSGAAWTVTLGLHARPRVAGPSPPAAVIDRAPDAQGLLVHMAGATAAFSVPDPDVGDTLTVVTARAPVKGLPVGRDLIEARLFASVQGLALQARSDDLVVRVDGDLVQVGRAKGLSLSAPAAGPASVEVGAVLDTPRAASLPGLVDAQAWSRTGSGGFVARYDELLRRAAVEAGPDGTSVDARMGLARFLVASQLAFEAIGVLDNLLRHEVSQADDAEFRALRGAANAMAGRLKDAEADFSVPALAADPATALWRGYVRVREGDTAGALPQFALGRSALSVVDPVWRGRFTRAEAEADLSTGDVGAARAVLHFAAAQVGEADDIAAATLMRARITEAGGQIEPALALYDLCAKSPFGAVSAPALLAATRLRLASGRLKPADAAEILDSLRYRWRGDATEIAVIGQLARLDLSEGRDRQALDALRAASTSLPNTPAAAGLRTELGDTFKALYLDGGADGMEPIQALALFYDFKELTPLGADGDLMVRRLVKRLVDADLLDQAASLLKYQVDNRLEGVAKAQVATDLASIDLLAGKPEAALGAINVSRTSLLPPDLNTRRRLVEARALAALGRYDHALELVGADTSPEALDVRGLVAWRGHAWAEAGRIADLRLGARWRSDAPLDADDVALLVRAGSAYSLAQDDAALTRLRTRYARLAAAAPQAAVLRVALAGLDASGAGSPGFGRVIAEADRLSGWVSGLKARLRDVAAPRSLDVETLHPIVAVKPAAAAIPGRSAG